MPPTRTSTALLAALVALAPACSRGPAAGEPPGLLAARPREAARVLVSPVERREMVRRLETTTRIESRSQVTVYPRASGVVQELLAEEGDRVAAGAVLALLDDRDQRLGEADARVALEEARANQPRLALATREAEARKETLRLAWEQAVRDHERNLAIARGGDDGLELLSAKELDASRLMRDRAESDLGGAVLAWERAQLEEQAGETAVHRAELALERAQVELDHMRIRAPLAGVVAERGVRVGDSVGATTAAFVVTDPDDLRTVFYRPQRELALFQPALADDVPSNGSGSGAYGADLLIDVRAEALPGRRFRGTIERISPTIDPESGNFRVTARLDPAAVDSPEARLLPGMLVRVEIVTERHPDALVVPKRAIRREGDRSVVFVVRAGRARSLPVREGFTDDQSLEITPLGGAALEEGEPVVVVGNRDLEDGIEVTPQDAAGEVGAAAEASAERGLIEAVEAGEAAPAEDGQGADAQGEAQDGGAAAGDGGEGR